MNLYELCDALRMERHRRRWTVDKAGTEAVISRRQITKMENGEFSSFNTSTLEQWAAAYNLRVEYILVTDDGETDTLREQRFGGPPLPPGLDRHGRMKSRPSS